jgi:hypothetical protein
LQRTDAGPAGVLRHPVFAIPKPARVAAAFVARRRASSIAFSGPSERLTLSGRILALGAGRQTGEVSRADAAQPRRDRIASAKVARQLHALESFG